MQIFEENHLPLINQKIDACLEGGLSAAYVKTFATRSPNLLLAVASLHLRLCLRPRRRRCRGLGRCHRPP